VKSGQRRLQEELQIKYGKMTKEQEELLHRLKLIMNYKTDKTLSENYNSILSKKNTKIIVEDIPTSVTDEVCKEFNFDSPKVTKENCYSLDCSADSGEGIPDDIIETFCCQVISTPTEELTDLFWQLMNDNKKVTVNYFHGFSKGKDSLSLWLIENHLFLKLYEIYSKNFADTGFKYWKFQEDINNSVLSDIIDENKKEFKELINGKVYIEGPIKSLSKYGKYSPPSEICISSKAKRESLDQEIVSKKESEEQKKYAEENKCPFISQQEEMEFLNWLNQDYPDIFKIYKLSLNPKKFCEDNVKKVAEYKIRSYEEKGYIPK